MKMKCICMLVGASLALTGCGGATGSINSAGSVVASAQKQLAKVVNPANLYRVEGAWETTLNLVNGAAKTGLIKKNSPTAIKVSGILKEVKEGIDLMRTTTDVVIYDNTYERLIKLTESVPALILGVK